MENYRWFPSISFRQSRSHKIEIKGEPPAPPSMKRPGLSTGQGMSPTICNDRGGSVMHKTHSVRSLDHLHGSGNLIESVVGIRVPERLTLGRLKPLRIQVVNVALHPTFHRDLHPQFILVNFG